MYGIRLKELRHEHGYTMQEVGRKLGIRKSSYACYESKYRKPPLDKLILLAKLYGVTIDYILGLTDERNYEESLHNRLKEILYNKGLHMDGDRVPEEAKMIVLDEAVAKILKGVKDAM